MKKFNMEIRNILGATVVRELSAGCSQLAGRLNKGYSQLQAKEQEEVNEKEHKETEKVTTVMEDVLVIGISNHNSDTKKQCITKLETLINVKNNAKQMQSKPLVNAEDDAINTTLEPTLVGANDDAIKKLVFTMASRNVSEIKRTVVENRGYRNL